MPCTAQEPDFVANDSGKNMPMPNTYICDLYSRRNNLDKSKPNLHGQKLLELCRSSGLRLLNGRLLGDNLGYCTCFSHTGAPSVIDYMLADHSLLRDFTYFYVHNISVASIHCMITAGLNTGHIEHDTEEICTVQGKKFIWQSGDDERFRNALLSSEIQEGLNCVKNQLQRPNCDIDGMVSGVTEIMTKTAYSAHIKSIFVGNKKRKKNPKKKKKWYDNHCRELYKDIKNLATILHDQPYNTSVLQNFRHKRKLYKKLLNQRKRSFQNTLIQQLEQLEEKDPTTFWNLYDQLSNQNTTKAGNPIDSATWMDHFKKLLNSPTVTHNQDIEDFHSSNKNKILHEFRFTLQEVRTAILGLKRKKSPGTDGILNEMFKCGIEILAPICTMLFNKILCSGVFPNAWRENILIPLHKKGDVYNPADCRGFALSSNFCKLFCSY